MGGLKAVAYARFSSDLQRDESIDAQLRAIQEFAEQNQFVLLSCYIDKAVSATTDNRVEFQKMIADAKAGKFDVVLVHKLDRFARNRSDSAIYRSILKKNNIKLISVLENFQDTPESVILESVIEGYNEYYSLNLRREVMKGLKENALKCKHTGGTPCLGYDVDPITKKLVVNDFEAQAVKLIFKLYLADCGYTEIIETLNNKCFKTKRGRPFGKNSLFEILRNEKYAGVYTYNKSASKNGEGKFNRHQSKSDDEIIRIEGGVPAIISREDFKAVQDKMHARKRRTAAFKAKQDYLLSGKIFCGVCSSTYAGNSRHPRPDHPLYVSYRCIKKNSSVKCKNPEIRKETLEELVLKKLSECVFDERIIPKLLQEYNQFAQNKDSDLTNRISSMQTKMGELEKGINNIVGVIMKTGSDALSAKLAELEEDKKKLVFALDEAKMELSDKQIDEKQLRSAFKKAKQMLGNGTLKNKKEIIEKYVDKIIMYPDKIEIFFCLPKGFMVTEVVEKQ